MDRAGFTLRVVSPDLFASLYERYFTLSDLRVGRLLNLSIALPVAYLLLGRYRALARPFERVFVVLGQRSLGAFVLHVYGLLILAHLPLPEGIVIGTLAQVTLDLRHRDGPRRRAAPARAPGSRDDSFADASTARRLTARVSRSRHGQFLTFARPLPQRAQIE